MQELYILVRRTAVILRIRDYYFIQLLCSPMYTILVFQFSWKLLHPVDPQWDKDKECPRDAEEYERVSVSPRRCILLVRIMNILLTLYMLMSLLIVRNTILIFFVVSHLTKCGSRKIIAWHVHFDFNVCNVFKITKFITKKVTNM